MGTFWHRWCAQSRIKIQLQQAYTIKYIGFALRDWYGEFSGREITANFDDSSSATLEWPVGNQYTLWSMDTAVSSQVVDFRMKFNGVESAAKVEVEEIEVWVDDAPVSNAMNPMVASSEGWFNFRCAADDNDSPFFVPEMRAQTVSTTDNEDGPTWLANNYDDLALTCDIHLANDVSVSLKKGKVNVCGINPSLGGRPDGINVNVCPGACTKPCMTENLIELQCQDSHNLYVGLHVLQSVLQQGTACKQIMQTALQARHFNG